jgi:hypothetical protein
MADNTTKILLLVIGLGIWANFAVVSRGVVAQAGQFSSTESHLNTIEDSTKEIDDLKDEVSDLKDKVGKISLGTCSNESLCP